MAVLSKRQFFCIYANLTLTKLKYLISAPRYNAKQEIYGLKVATQPATKFNLAELYGENRGPQNQTVIEAFVAR